MPKPIQQEPIRGWGTLSPDPEISDETLALAKAMLGLPRGQIDALLTRALHRELCLSYDEKCEEEPLPDFSNVSGSLMVSATHRVWNSFHDALGLGLD